MGLGDAPKSNIINALPPDTVHSYGTLLSCNTVQSRATCPFPGPAESHLTAWASGTFPESNIINAWWDSNKEPCPQEDSDNPGFLGVSCGRFGDKYQVTGMCGALPARHTPYPRPLACECPARTPHPRYAPR